MKDIEEATNASVDNPGVIYTDTPMTHIFYEYQGERTVDALRLVMDGHTLWHEHAANNTEHKHEVLHLWKEAEALLASRHATPTHSYIEWLRLRATMGDFDPKKSLKQKKPYAYRGMLIAAIYLQEAMRLCEAGNLDRVWHITVMAYYYLGMSTTPSPTQLAARASKKRHEEAVEVRRALVLTSLEAIEKRQEIKKTIKSIDDAKDEVINVIGSNGKCLEELMRVDELSANRDKYSDALDRFRNLLDIWSSPNSAHPDIAEAFARYGQGKCTKKIENIDTEIPRSALDAGTIRYMRLVNFLEDGHTLTTEFSRHGDEETLGTS